MVNHIRTLLLNRTSRSQEPIADGTDYVDPNFTRLELPTWAKQIREVIFGSLGDSSFENYMLFECLKLLHSTDYSVFMYDLDTRITYDVNNSPFTSVQYGTSIINQTGPNIVIRGADSSLNGLGLAKKTWNIIASSSDLIISTRYIKDTTIYLFTSGYSGPYRLPYSDLSFYLTDTPSDNDIWTATSYTRPDKSWVTIYNSLLKLNSAVNSVFSNFSVEPYRTFCNLWTTHPALQFKLSGLLLAYCYKLEELRHERNKV